MTMSIKNYILSLLFFIVGLFTSSISLLGQTENADSIDYIQLSNQVFNSKIKTVQFYREGWDLSPPVIKLNSNEKLVLSFDDLEADGKEFMFTIRHCDANWLPSILEKYQYIDGYEEDYIYEYEFSVNTIVPYTHYELLFPTTAMKPTLPGNYMLKVFVDTEDSIFFTRRFMVLDQKVNTEGKVKQATTIDDRNYKQEVDFEIISPNYQILNPYVDLKVTITQNQRWDNAITYLKPKMAVNGRYDYNYDYENVFNGVNEFRSADFKSLNYKTENIGQIEYTREGYQVFLLPDKKRTFQVYKTEDDINGYFKIKTEDQDRTETESEYVNVHFRLTYPAPMIDADIYIFGGLSDWSYLPEFKLDYNFKTKAYEKSVLLKQGYYNYIYVLKNRGQSLTDDTFIEGNHWETNNQYTIWVYNREIGEDFDRLVGVTHINSHE
ncbi:MAG: DUF5103 domain-containing protein [Bacteroidales bacterium]|nr:DUF5103 domain-containing protein [Bacteroidales bacterium]MCF8404060.1 DUF5103 domain-containing protein [Bacteroidales bacterium]